MGRMNVVPDQPPFGIASETLRRLLAARAADPCTLRADAVLRAFRSFAATRFESPHPPVSDAVGYRFVRKARRGRELAVIVLARRFGLRKPRGGEVEVRCELIYPAWSELAGLPDHEEWWYRGGGEPLELDEWLDRLTTRMEWAVLRWRQPASVDVDLVEL